MAEKFASPSESSTRRVAIKLKPSVLIPTPEADRHGFDTYLTPAQIKSLSRELGKASGERIDAGELSDAEREFYEKSEELF